jgi:hypothetical protein
MKLYWRIKKNGKWTWTPWQWTDQDFDELWSQESTKGEEE